MSTKKIVVILLCILILILLIAYNIFYINIKVLTVSENTYTSEKVDTALDGLTIVFFSDLHYGTAIKEAELEKLADTITSFDPDIVLFGGDLFDDSDNYEFASDERAKIIEDLDSIKARFGKFAVLGNHDLGSKAMHDNAVDILESSGFEVLDNSSSLVYKDGSYINIVGVASMILGSPDVEKAYSAIDSSDLTITLCHTPDVFGEVTTDLMFAGHSHGGQVYLPIINDFYRPNGAKKYFKGTYKKDDSLLHVTNGVGTTYFDARFLSDSEIVVYKLRSSAS